MRSMKWTACVSGRGQRGLTLLEVLIALTILSIALIALSRSQSQSLSVAGDARATTTLALLAQAKMAEVEGQGTLNNAAGTGTFGRDYPDYAWDVKVSDTDIRSLKKIEVTVRDTRRAGDKGLQLVLYRTRPAESAEGVGP